jgi:hypothetical protein
MEKLMSLPSKDWAEQEARSILERWSEIEVGGHDEESEDEALVQMIAEALRKARDRR